MLTQSASVAQRDSGRNRGRPSHENGASAVLVAASLILMIGMAAVAIDLGAGFNESTQAQSGVDFAALAAVNEAKGTTAALATAAGEAVARNYVARNLPGRTLNWATCTDPSKPAEFVNWVAANPCISFSANFAKARVLLPADDVPTTFGRLLGSAFIRVRELAEAGSTIGSSAQVVPFVPNSSAPHNCLYSNQAAQTVPPCDGPSNGNFGYLDLALHGNSDPGFGTPATCAQGTANTRIAINLTKGSDHNMAVWAAPTYNDHAVCPNRAVDVNELEVKTGSPGAGITDGLVTGISGNINGQAFSASPGRLRCSPVSGAPACPFTRTVRGISNMDDTPLWHWMDPQGLLFNDLNSNGSFDSPAESWTFLTWPSSCRLPDGNGTPPRKPTNTVEMDTCLADWVAAGGGQSPLFVKAMQNHKRFVATPVFASYPTTGSAASYRIMSFAPIYLRTIYFQCNANSCATVFTPGEPVAGACGNPITIADTNCGHSASGPDNVEGLTGSLLSIGMLHEDTQTDFPGTKSTRKSALSK